MRPKVEALGYTCNPLPDAKFDKKVSLSCSPEDTSTGSILTFFNQKDVATGAEVADAYLDEMVSSLEKIDGASGVDSADPSQSRGAFGRNYRALDGAGVVGICQFNTENCEKIAPELGLTAAPLEGALTDEDLERQAREAGERAAAEYEKNREEEKAKRQAELQVYKGWSNLDEATEQLAAWDLRCNEDSASRGKVAWCSRSIMKGSSLILVNLSAERLAKDGVFDNVDRTTMHKVTGDKWVFICSESLLDQCNMVAEKTGKKVEKGI